MYAVTRPRVQKLTMGQRREDIPGFARISKFLLSEIGMQANGMTLTMLSALSRQGRDPWETSCMLMRLPHKEATVTLSRLLASMPEARLLIADTTLFAPRLLVCLRDDGGTPSRPERGERMEWGHGEHHVVTRRKPRISKMGWHAVRITVLVLAAIIGLTLHMVGRQSSGNNAISPDQTQSEHKSAP